MCQRILLHHKAVRFQIFCFQIIGAPIAHSNKDGEQASAKVSQGILDLRRDDGKHFPMDQLLRFQLPKLLREHLGGSAGNGFSQFRKAKGAVGKMPEDERLVFAADKIQR